MSTHPSGAGNPKARSRGRRLWGALAATAMVSAMLVVGSQQSGAATTKNINASCTGREQADRDLLGVAAPGGVLSAPLTATVDAPPFVEPGQTDVPISVTWTMDLPADFANTAIGLGVSTLDVLSPNVDVVIEGPTDTTGIEGRPPNQSITLVSGQSIKSTFGPFSSTLTNIGNSGIIKVRSEKFLFDVSLSVAGTATTVKIQCATGQTLATIPVKIAGSPDIVQPIELASVPGQPNTIDLFDGSNPLVTNGRTKDGIEQQIDRTTLKIVEGDATIVDGKLVATAPAAGESADVTFEVCAGTIQVAEADPGASEVQELRIFEDLEKIAFKRQMGARFNFDGEDAPQVLWSARPKISFLTDVWKPVPDASNREAEFPNWWQNNVNTFALAQSDFRAPSAAEMQAALESIPTIGPGNVKVTKGAPQSAGDATQPRLRYHPYTLEFQGNLANADLGQVGTSKLYSFLPQEIKATLLGAASGAGGDGEEGEEADKTPIPGAEGVPDLPAPAAPIGGDAKKYVDYLNARAGNLASQGAILDGLDGSPGYITTVQLMLKVVGENIGALIDVGAATALLNQLFQPSPEVLTTSQGVDPVEAQFQELCSQGVVTLTSASAAGATATATPAAADASVEGATATNSGGASLSPAG